MVNLQQKKKTLLPIGKKLLKKIEYINKKIGNRKKIGKKYSTCCVPINDLFSDFRM
jgi:hypothetical protein